MNSTKPNNKLVLIAEDDSDEQYFICNAVKTLEYPVTILFVEHGQEVLNVLKAGQKPDMIMLDLNMPVMDGMQTLKILKSSKSYSHIPVVVYTTSHSEQDVHESYQFGANTYIAKPTGFMEMESCLRCLFDYWFKAATLDTHGC